MNKDATPKDKERIRALRRKVWNHYRKYGRHDLPWRLTDDPYYIMVSEVMLQQTQVDRVWPKYEKFLTAFPTVQDLAHAQPAQVLAAWQGLGYNRRALALSRMANEVVTKHGGSIPKGRKDLETLPGIGVYTAGAVLVFAYNQPEVLIETNIRTVMLHELMPERSGVSDAELYQLVGKALDVQRPREWYWALMDYGTHLKRSGVQVNHRTRQYKKQAAFKGSDRQIRGAIVRTLVHQGPISKEKLVRAIPFPHARVLRQVDALAGEGMVKRKGKHLTL